ncbi:MAG: tRNA glutamyl-Q(34) synthetase GluQRS [Paracoccaceae bacterium]
MTYRTRFAPSPTGPLHLGHAYSALLAYDLAKAAGGDFVLRIEDTDCGRCKPEFEAAIIEDLNWLGLDWEQPVWRQANRLDEYRNALDRLASAGFCYPCSCSRKDIRDALSAPQEGQPHLTPDGFVYPGTCRHRSMDDRQDTDAIRLDVGKVLSAKPNIAEEFFTEEGPNHTGVHRISKKRMLLSIGDIVLARRDINAASYHLAVVVDDAAQEITHVIRGEDLFEATYIHRLLQTLLGLPTPVYHHHRLIRDEDGKRLAKRTDAKSLKTLRENGATFQSIRQQLGL